MIWPFGIVNPTVCTLDPPAVINRGFHELIELLDKLDRAIAEGEVGASGVIAGARVDEVALRRDDLGLRMLPVIDCASLLK